MEVRLDARTLGPVIVLTVITDLRIIRDDHLQSCVFCS